MFKKYIALMFITLGIGGLYSCSKPVQTEHEAGYYKEVGDEYFSEKKYRNAIDSYENALMRAETPDDASRIQLALANSYFLSKQYADAIPVYEVYLDYYGSSKEADLAILRIGMAHFNLMRRASQDQTQTLTALKYFEQVKERNPELTKEYDLDQKISDIKQRLAEKEYIIARYYGRIWEKGPEMRRYKYLVDNYPESRRYELAAYRLVKLLIFSGDTNEAENYFTLLKSKFPESEYIEKINKDFEDKIKEDKKKENEAAKKIAKDEKNK